MLKSQDLRSLEASHIGPCVNIQVVLGVVSRLYRQRVIQYKNERLVSSEYIRSTASYKTILNKSLKNM